MLLHDLIYELQLCIVGEVESERDVNAFVRSNRVLYDRFNRYLYRHNVQSHGSTGLLRAAKYGHEAAIRKFLDEGADPDVMGDGSPPTMPIDFAIRDNHLEVTKLLLSANPVNENSLMKRAARALFDAASCGNEEVMKLLVKTDNTDFKYQDDDIKSALSTAANNAHDGVLLLILNGTTIDFNESEEAKITGHTLLSAAAWAGLDASVKKLLEKGCPSRDMDGKPGPLWSAVCRGHTGAVKLLLSMGGFNPHNSSDNTAIMYASVYGHAEVLRLLIDECSADPETQKMIIETAVHHSIRGFGSETNDTSYVVRLLLDNYIDLNYRYGSSNDTLFTSAARHGRTIAVEVFIEEYGAGTEARDRDGRTGLSLAAMKGDYDTTWLLLQKYGADPESRDDQGRTPLSLAATSSETERVIKLLLAESRVDPNSRDNNGRSPLSWAATCFKSAIEVLLAYSKVDPNAQDISGRTPLSWAAQKAGETKFLALFTDDRVDPNLPDKDGRTPLSWAMEGQLPQPVIERMLADSRINPDSRDRNGRTPLSFAVERSVPCRRTTIDQRLLEDDRVVPDSQDEDGQSPISRAIEFLLREAEEVLYANPAIRVLLSNDRVAPDSRDKTGRTPLSWAAEHSHSEADQIAVLLADSRIDPDSRDENGRTPLSWAAEKGGENHVRLLLADSRVARNSKDKDGRTPLSWAAMNNNSMVREALLQAGCT